MEAQKPLSLIFKLLNIYGLWGEISKCYRNFSIAAFIISLITPLIFIISSIFGSENGIATISTITYSGAILLLITFIVTFIINKPKILEVLSNVDDILRDSPDSKLFIYQSCRTSTKIFYPFVLCHVLIVIFIVFAPLITGQFFLSTSYFGSLLSLPGAFYIIWMLENFLLVYGGCIFGIIDFLSFSFLMIIHGYIKFCVDCFEKSDIKSRIEMHLKIKR